MKLEKMEIRIISQDLWGKNANKKNIYFYLVIFIILSFTSILLTNLLRAL